MLRQPQVIRYLINQKSLARHKLLQGSTEGPPPVRTLQELASLNHIHCKVLLLWLTSSYHWWRFQKVLESMNQWLNTDRQACVNSAMVLETWSLLKPKPHSGQSFFFNFLKVYYNRIIQTNIILNHLIRNTSQFSKVLLPGLATLTKQ